MKNETTLIDHIYEAAVIPERWPDVLGSLSEFSRAEGGVLYVVTPKRSSDGSMQLEPIPRWTASDTARPYVEAFVRDGWLHGNIRAERAVKLAHAGFVTDHDLFSPDEIDKAPFYQWARQQGVGWHSGLTIQAPSGDVIIFNFERRYEAGPIGASTIARLDKFKADLARASLISSRLKMERAKTTVCTLSLLGLPAAVISSRTTILAANDLFQRYMPSHIVERAFGIMHLVNARADRLLALALSDLLIDTEAVGACSVRSIPISSKDGDVPIVVHAIPIRLSAKEVFSGASTIIIITPISPRELPSASVVQGLFDLTAAETKVARLIGSGESINHISRVLNVSPGTLRCQLKSIFQKTGVSRQAELVYLLSAVNASQHRVDPLP